MTPKNRKFPCWVHWEARSTERIDLRSSLGRALDWETRSVLACVLRRPIDLSSGGFSGRHCLLVFASAFHAYPIATLPLSHTGSPTLVLKLGQLPMISGKICWAAPSYSRLSLALMGGTWRHPVSELMHRDQCCRQCRPRSACAALPRKTR